MTISKATLDRMIQLDEYSKATEAKMRVAQDLAEQALIALVASDDIEEASEHIATFVEQLRTILEYPDELAS